MKSIREYIEFDDTRKHRIRIKLTMFILMFIFIAIVSLSVFMVAITSNKHELGWSAIFLFLPVIPILIPLTEYEFY